MDDIGVPEAMSSLEDHIAEKNEIIAELHRSIEMMSASFADVQGHYENAIKRIQAAADRAVSLERMIYEMNLALLAIESVLAEDGVREKLAHFVMLQSFDDRVAALRRKS